MTILGEANPLIRGHNYTGQNYTGHNYIRRGQPSDPRLRALERRGLVAPELVALVCELVFVVHRICRGRLRRQLPLRLRKIGRAASTDVGR